MARTRQDPSIKLTDELPPFGITVSFVFDDVYDCRHSTRRIYVPRPAEALVSAFDRVVERAIAETHAKPHSHVSQTKRLYSYSIIGLDSCSPIPHVDVRLR